MTNQQNIILGINQADLLFKTEDTPSGVDMNTITNDNIILQEKINDLYNGIFKDVFKNFDNVSIDSVAVFSVLHKWNLRELKNKIYSFIN